MPALHLVEPAEEVHVVEQVQERAAAADERLVQLLVAHSILVGLAKVVHSQTLVEISETDNLQDTWLADWAQRVSRSLVGTA